MTDLGIAKSFFLGRLRSDLAFPFPELSAGDKETLNLLLDSLRKFARDKIDPKQIDKESRVPPEVIQGLAQLGILGMAVPEEYGGYGFPATSYARVIEELVAIDASVAITIAAHQSIGFKALLLFGTEEQKKKWLPDLASGKILAAYCLTEAGSGSDAQSLQTAAIHTDDGATWILNGEKIWITNGGIASAYTVFAKTEVVENGEKKKKVTCFWVPKDLGGITTGKEEDKLGLKGSSTTVVHFENVRVPKENVIGEVGKGFKIAMEVLNQGRLGLGAGSLGGCKFLLGQTALHAKTRHQFQQPIANFEMIKDKIADMTTSTFALENMVYLTSGLVDKKFPDYSIEAAMCKIYGTEILWRVCNHAIQTAGGIAYVKEYPYERMMRDARINMIFEGTNEILHLFVALNGLKEPSERLKSKAKALKNPLTAIPAAMSLATGGGKGGVKPPPVPGVLQEEAKVVADAVGELGAASRKLIMKYKKEIMEKEFMQQRISDIATDIYGILSSLSRTSRTMKEKGEKEAKREIELTQAFTKDAAERIERNLAKIDKNDDPLTSKVSDATVAAGGYGIGLY